MDDLASQLAAAQQAGAHPTTYSAAISGLVPVASATDVFTITGSPTATVRVTRCEVSGTATAISVSAQWVKRSTANSGGSPASVPAVPHDSSDPAATATVLSYTANPVGLGTLVGLLRAVRAALPGAGTLGAIVSLAFGDRPAKPIVLRGVNEVLALNLAGATIAGGNLNISVEWTEA